MSLSNQASWQRCGAPFRNTQYVAPARISRDLDLRKKSGDHVGSDCFAALINRNAKDVAGHVIHVYRGPAGKVGSQCARGFSWQTSSVLFAGLFSSRQLRIVCLSIIIAAVQASFRDCDGCVEASVTEECVDWIQSNASWSWM